MISIKIDTVDRTEIVDFGSLTRQDRINKLADTLRFTIHSNVVQTFKPESNSAVEMYDGVDLVFAGKISKVSKQRIGNGEVKHTVECKDPSYDSDRIMINESYEDMTVNDIIADMISFVNSESGLTFTGNNVDCDLTITKVAFARIPFTEALDRLSELTGYSFYIDYEYDIHFFVKNTELAPFSLTDSNGNAIASSMQFTNDMSQIRNRVYIKGAEIEGDERTETLEGNGTRLFFKLSNKFSAKPAVSVDGTPVTVGVDYLDNEADYDCFWDFDQSYIRFKTGTVPGAVDVEVTGLPLYTPEFLVEDPISIAQYGIFEFAKTDKSIKSREQAVSYAKAQLEAYRDGVIEGSFKTYESGLRSGQVITITSTELGISEDFLIQAVTMKMKTIDFFEFSVQLATLRTVGIIDFFLGLIRTEQRVLESDSSVIIEKTVYPKEYITLDDSAEVNTDDYPQAENAELGDDVIVQALDFPIEFVAGPYTPTPSNPTDYKRVAIADHSNAG